MPQPNLHPFEKQTLGFIRKHHLIDPEDRILVGVSGGADSVALLHALLSLEGPLEFAGITVLHFDHRLRSEASSEDRRFVERLAERFGLPFLWESKDVLEYQKGHRISLEMAARACRHGFFRKALDRCGAQKLALGHTANDQAEEVLLRLIRGTGPAGLAGMLPRSGRKIVRPILFATRREILGYLKDSSLSFREDSSNLDPFCQRNVLRLEVFPIIEKSFHSRVVETISRHTELAREEEDFWALEVESRWQSVCSEETRSRIVLKIEDLAALHPALRRRLLRFALERLKGDLSSIYAVHIEALSLLALRNAQGKSAHLPGGLRGRLEGKSLIISDASSQVLEPPSEALLNETIHGPGNYVFPSFELDLRIEDVSSLPADAKSPALRHVARMDAEKISWPLLVRNWKPGDRFNPLGLGGSKKLQDFFTDAKIPGSERRRIPLLCDQEKICWIVGHRMDNRVKVTSETSRVLIATAHNGLKSRP